MSRRDQIRGQRQRAKQRNRLLLIVGVIVVALVIAGILILPNINKPVGAIATLAPRTYLQEKDNGMGDPNAPVKIVEFADYQCPYCENFYTQTEQQIVDTYVATGKVYFVYRSVGAWIGQESQRAAEAAYCAGDQNKYFEYHDILYNNQTGENVGDFTDTRLVAFAKTLGLNMSTFNSCFNSDKNTSRVTQDTTDATAAGIQGTPGFLVNGKLVQGAQPFSVFQTAIEAALSGKK
jgi:protein-disulfide isomerase